MPLLLNLRLPSSLALPLSEAEILEAIRKAVGDDIDLAVDWHWEYGTRDVLRFAQMVEPIQLTFLGKPAASPLPGGN